jgi:hypothetical protein
MRTLDLKECAHQFAALLIDLPELREWKDRKLLVATLQRIEDWLAQTGRPLECGLPALHKIPKREKAIEAIKAWTEEALTVLRVIPPTVGDESSSLEWVQEVVAVLELAAMSDQEVPLPKHGPIEKRKEFEALQAIQSLISLAESGSQRAVFSLHQIAVAAVRRLNSRHQELADSVIEWPILVPREKELRDERLKSAAALRIGGVKGGGKGRPNNLESGAQKGFALRALNTMSGLRGLGRSIGADLLCGDLQSAVSGMTGVTNCPRETWKRITLLEDYSAQTRNAWVDAIADLLLLNKHLIPPPMEKRGTTQSPEHDCSGAEKTRIDVNARGFPDALRRMLRDGLSRVSAMPR